MRLLRAGDLTAVWVSDQEREMMGELRRARIDMTAQERKARRELNTFVVDFGRN